MIFRLSEKLAKKLKEGPLPSVPLDENPYADWSAHLFRADRTQYIIVANTKSLYSVVMYGKGITDDSDFIDRTLSNLREFMEADGQAFVYQRFIAPAGGSVRFAKGVGSLGDRFDERIGQVCEDLAGRRRVGPVRHWVQAQRLPAFGTCPEQEERLREAE